MALSLKSLFTKISKYKNDHNKESIFTKNLVPKKYRENIGDYTYGNIIILEWGEGADLRIGKYCSIADGTIIMLGGEHRTDWITTYPFTAVQILERVKKIKGHPKTKGNNVKIGNDVWIGKNVIILSSVTVGDGSVIGAGAVVTKDVKPYTIVAGNPAKQIKLRFKKSQIKQLLEVQWWNWPQSIIRKNISILCSTAVNELINTNKEFQKSPFFQNKKKLVRKQIRK